MTKSNAQAFVTAVLAHSVCCNSSNAVSEYEVVVVNPEKLRFMYSYPQGMVRQK
ncbi:hypothetical protein ACQFX9_07270 [Aliinostoc sp. HNIBRCY26]|uniref:hypothetical protein n=1 Tax=Aliinostoc sp. HNIBRCY26 TaxID=3418997 RepID=UPI003D093054